VTHEHAPRVNRRDRAALPFQAVCPCGWHGPHHSAWHKADTDATEHLELTEAEHRTSVIPVPALGGTAPPVWQAVCTCGWSWPNRFYRDRAAHDAEAHLRRVQAAKP
jgi:hypothetical protein